MLRAVVGQTWVFILPPRVRHQKEQTATEPLLTNPECRHLNAAYRQSPLRRSNQSIAGQQRSKQPETSPKMKNKKTVPRPKRYTPRLGIPHLLLSANQPLTNRPPILHRPSSRAPHPPFFCFPSPTFRCFSICKLFEPSRFLICSRPVCVLPHARFSYPLACTSRHLWVGNPALSRLCL